MASFLSAILFLAVALLSSQSHHIFAESARKELRIKLPSQKAPVQFNRVDPSQVVQLSWQPRVFIYRGFITDEECNHLISMARTRIEGRDSVGESTKFMSIISQKNSSDFKDDVVSRIEERISAWSFLPHENSRSLQVQHYTSEWATEKYDYFGSKSTLEVNQPLMATVLLYLSNATQGGELVFPDSKIKSMQHELLRPVKGNAILFFNVWPNASPDKTSSHERRPVLDGELWCAVKLFYLRPIISQELPAGSDDGECIDQDDACPHWAASGECQRNPVFMVGSPDYYGTCRKSCKVC